MSWTLHLSIFNLISYYKHSLDYQILFTRGFIENKNNSNSNSISHFQDGNTSYNSNSDPLIEFDLIYNQKSDKNSEVRNQSPEELQGNRDQGFQKPNRKKTQSSQPTQFFHNTQKSKKTFIEIKKEETFVVNESLSLHRKRVWGGEQELKTTRQLLTHYIPPKYPRLSIKKGEEGRLKIGLNIHKGQIHSLQILESSGYPRLDQSALEALHQWQFKPEIHTSMVQIIRFELKKE